MVGVTAEDTVDNLISEYIGAAKVLSKHGIDFCTEGNKLLKEACAEARISLRKLLREIADNEQDRKKAQADPAQINIDELTLFIEIYHHHYTAENIIFVKTSLSRLVRLYGREHPELIEIKKVFEEMTGLITVHMSHEEFIIFPYIRQLTKKGKKAKSSIFKSVKSPIAEVMTDHESGHVYLKKLHHLTHHYTPPIEGSAFKVTYAAMQQFEEDLHKHMFLEDQILFPKALEMETELTQASSSRVTKREV